MRHILAVAALLTSALLTHAGEFTVVALPDTQNYSESYPEIFDSQTQWCADNYQTGAWNVQFVTHLGDLVQHAAYLGEWDNAEASMSRLDIAGVPYGTCVGNHDILYPGDYYDPDGLNYLSKFAPSYYAGEPWYGGASPSGLSNYQVIETEGRDYLFLHLLVETPAGELAWAQQVLNQHRDKPVMLSTHRYLFDWRVLGQGRYGEFQYTFEPLYRHDGIKANDLFNNFVAANRQIYMVICGHCDGQYRQTSQNLAGLTVHEILVDYQSSWDNGGDGYLRLMKFKPDADEIECHSYSPYQDDWNPGGDDTFTLAIDLDNYTMGHPVLRFQNGVNGYADTRDTWVGENDPGTSHGNDSIVVVDDDTENSWFGDYVGQGLFRFDNITQDAVREGDPAPTRIPVGATVHSAKITLNLADDTDAWDPDFTCHRMTRDWNESSTWNSLSGGISPGADCEASPFAVFTGDNNPDHDYHRTFDAITPVQHWVSYPDENHGFCVLPERDKKEGDAAPGEVRANEVTQKGDEKFYDDGIDIRSSEDGSSALRPALDVEFSYIVLNTPPTIDASLCAIDPPNECATEITVNEGRQVNLTITATDPNPLDPLIFRINGDDVGYATGNGTLEHWLLMEDEGTYPFDAVVLDDEDTVAAGNSVVHVLNVAPTITSVTPDLTVAVDEVFDFSVAAEDPGVLDVLTYAWDFDGDGEFDDYLGDVGQWSYATAGVYAVVVEVADDDGGHTTDGFVVTVVGLKPGDCDCDGDVDYFDINYFLAALDSEATWRQLYADQHAGAEPPCLFANCDCDGDGDVDYFDINPFIDLLGS